MQAVLLLFSAGFLGLGWWCRMLGATNPVHSVLSIEFMVIGGFLAMFTCLWGYISQPRE